MVSDKNQTDRIQRAESRLLKYSPKICKISPVPSFWEDEKCEINPKMSFHLLVGQERDSPFLDYEVIPNIWRVVESPN